jgi:hypothetical protein
MPSSTTQPRITSLLQQNMARPDGVAALMDTDIGAGGEENCGLVGQVRKPTIGIGYGDASGVATLPIAMPVPICLLGFEAGIPIQVTIRSPTGRLERMTAPAPPCGAAGCASQTAWAALPGDPLGRYEMTAEAPSGLGRLSAKARITVEPAQPFSVMVIGSPGDPLMRITVRPGTTIGMALAGFRARRSIDLVFFHTPSFDILPKGLRFRAVTTVKLDASGGAIFRFQTSPTDPLGCYAVNTMPPQRALREGLSPPYRYPREVWSIADSNAQFCLQR